MYLSTGLPYTPKFVYDFLTVQASNSFLLIAEFIATNDTAALIYFYSTDAFNRDLFLLLIIMYDVKQSRYLVTHSASQINTLRCDYLFP